MLDAFQAPINDESIDEVAISALKRQGATDLADALLDWFPAGLIEDEGEPDDDE